MPSNVEINAAVKPWRLILEIKVNVTTDTTFDIQYSSLFLHFSTVLWYFNDSKNKLINIDDKTSLWLQP